MIYNVSLVSSEEHVNIIISNDPLVAPPGCREGVDYWREDFQISKSYLLAKMLWRALICSSVKIVPLQIRSYFINKSRLMMLS